MALTNKEKAATRVAVMNKIAEMIAKDNSAFREFLAVKEPTWRRFETFMKNRFEAGGRLEIVLDSAAGN